MLPMRARNSRGYLLLALVAASALTLAACGDREREPPPIEPTELPAAEKAAPKPATGKPVASKVSSDDPLLGTWEVVEVTGRYAEANTGLVYHFRQDGKAKVSAVAMVDIPGGRALPPGVKNGDLIENIWSWKRVAPNEIEMTHPDSPMVARITTTIEGDTMKFEWNKAKGGSIFVMERRDRD